MTFFSWQISVVLDKDGCSEQKCFSWLCILTYKQSVSKKADASLTKVYANHNNGFQIFFFRIGHNQKISSGKESVVNFVTLNDLLSLVFVNLLDRPMDKIQFIRIIYSWFRHHGSLCVHCCVQERLSNEMISYKNTYLISIKLFKLINHWNILHCHWFVVFVILTTIFAAEYAKVSLPRLTWTALYQIHD